MHAENPDAKKCFKKVFTPGLSNAGAKKGFSDYTLAFSKFKNQTVMKVAGLGFKQSDIIQNGEREG